MINNQNQKIRRGRTQAVIDALSPGADQLPFIEKKLSLCTPLLQPRLLHSYEKFTSLYCRPEASPAVEKQPIICSEPADIFASGGSENVTNAWGGAKSAQAPHQQGFKSAYKLPAKVDKVWRVGSAISYMLLCSYQIFENLHNKSEKINKHLIEACRLLKVYHQQICDPHNIAMIICYLGKLAHISALVRKHVAGSIIIKLLKKLPHAGPSHLQVVSVVHGLGQLAEANCLDLRVPTTLLLPLLDMPVEANPNACGLADVLFGLGRLTKANALAGAIPANYLIALIQSLSRAKPNEQHLSKAIYGLGRLINGGVIDGIIPAAYFNVLLEALRNLRYSCEQAEPAISVD